MRCDWHEKLAPENNADRTCLRDDRLSQRRDTRHQFEVAATLSETCSFGSGRNGGLGDAIVGRAFPPDPTYLGSTRAGNLVSLERPTHDLRAKA
jgi:hypothetical protein